MLKKRTFLPVVVLGLATALGSISAPPAQAQLLSISESQERQAGAQAAAQLERQYGVSRDRHANNLVRSIGEDLARVSSRPNLDWTFKVLNHNSLNAVSLPGGYIYVFQGLIDATRGDEQMLAGVLAHEVGHVAGKHHVKSMEKQMGVGLLSSILLKGKSRDIAGLAGNFLAMKWSRKDEYDADKRGVEYAARSGNDPAGLPRFLQVLESRHGGGSTSGPASWMASHPATSERIKRAYAHSDQLGGSRSTSRTTRSTTRRNRDESRYGGSTRRRAPDLFGDRVRDR